MQFSVKNAIKLISCAVFWIISSNSLFADELLLSFGKGSQPNSAQDNKQIGIDYSFYQIDRSPRSSLSLGASYSHLKTNTLMNKTVHIFGLYPQLTLHPKSCAAWRGLCDSYFFVRALGPSYISENQLGARKQRNHFSFQAQVGVGYERRLDKDKSLLLQISWKHFSNANLFSENDGIDVPLVATVGIKF